MPELSRWVCLECHTIYDPAHGDKKGGIPLGVPFEDLPDTYCCLVCGVHKSKKGVFRQLDD